VQQGKIKIIVSLINLLWWASQSSGAVL